MKGFKFIKPIICMELWEELSPYHLMVDTIKLKPRRYQIELIKSAYAGKNTLIVLPTGLGKTLIAIFAIARALHNGKKAIILAYYSAIFAAIAQRESVPLKRTF